MTEMRKCDREEFEYDLELYGCGYYSICIEHSSCPCRLDDHYEFDPKTWDSLLEEYQDLAHENHVEYLKGELESLGYDLGDLLIMINSGELSDEDLTGAKRKYDVLSKEFDRITAELARSGRKA